MSQGLVCVNVHKKSARAEDTSENPELSPTTLADQNSLTWFTELDAYRGTRPRAHSWGVD